MTENKPLEVYIEHLLKKAREIQLPDTDVLSIFISNVTPSIRECLMMRQPNTLTEALSIARLKNATEETCKKTQNTDVDKKLEEILQKVSTPKKTVNTISNSTQIDSIEK